MCGILGIISRNTNLSVYNSLTFLKRLEYRGYDSSGVMYLNPVPVVYKKQGKIEALQNLLVGKKEVSTNFLMSHTRWATHGKPSDSNSHPHYSENKKVYLVHNGIIENYVSLKNILLEANYKFYSETDSEVMVNFIDYICNLNPDYTWEQQVRLALSRIQGTYGIILYHVDYPEKVIVARHSSPLVLGMLEDKLFISSDYYSFIEKTRDIINLQDGEIGIINRTTLKLEVRNMDTNTKVEPNILKLDMKLDSIEKSVFEHFMLKEILKQSESIQDSMRGRINSEGNVKLGGLEVLKDNQTLIDKLSKATRIILCACGTSLHAAMVGKYIIEELADIPVEVEQASEFRYRKKSITCNTVVIGISQSGETADTIEAVKSMVENSLCLGICNTVACSLSQITEGGIYLHVGPEIGVASTKAFTGQLSILYMLAIRLAQTKNIRDSLSKKI